MRHPAGTGCSWEGKERQFCEGHSLADAKDSIVAILDVTG
jgi:hypothetical protein